MLAQILPFNILEFTRFEWALVLVPALVLSAAIVRLKRPSIVGGGWLLWLSNLEVPDYLRTKSKRKSASVPAVVAPTVHAELSDENQWSRVRGVLKTSVARAEKANVSHGAAARQLDAADYELSRMLDELVPLMPHLGEAKAVVAAQKALREASAEAAELLDRDGQEEVREGGSERIATAAA